MLLHNLFSYFLIGLIALCVIIHILIGVYNLIYYNHWKGKDKELKYVHFITFLLPTAILSAIMIVITLILFSKFITKFGELILNYFE